MPCQTRSAVQGHTELSPSNDFLADEDGRSGHRVEPVLSPVLSIHSLITTAVLSPSCAIFLTLPQWQAKQQIFTTILFPNKGCCNKFMQEIGINKLQSLISIVKVACGKRGHLAKTFSSK